MIFAKRYLIIIVFGMVFPLLLCTQSIEETTFPVRGICLKIPQKNNLQPFLDFVDNELVPAKVNLLVLRIDYNYQYHSHPELANDNAYSKAEMKQIVATCQKNNIRLIPQINLLGHQSWHSNLSNLLKVYPQFDETPTIQLPEKYVWPNEDGLYCKSYCPLHPEVHKVVFALMDEIVAVCEADAFHAGLDEVFYIGAEECPRCNGRNKAELFAGEVTKIHNHLAQNGKELWMWGDRLIDGKTTGIGMWEASMNNTHQAIDLIPKSVVINDWHYERADPTAAYFAMKGFSVVTCPWRTASVATEQVEQILHHRKNVTKSMQLRFMGMMQTIWSSTEEFMAVYKGENENKDPNGNQVECFKALVKAWIEDEEVELKKSEDNPQGLKRGMTIRHQKYGLGKIVDIDKKNVATILFEKNNEKRIILKFTKFEIIKKKG